MAQMADGSGLAVSPAVAAACGSHSPLLSTLQVGAAIREGSSSSAHTDLSVNEVYAMTTHLGQELQKLASEYGTVGMEGLVELVAQTLEKLEHYVVENERLNTENCRILLELDQLVLAKESEEILQTELQAMKLVSEERGRQRDALALRVGGLEAAKEKLSQQVYELKKANAKFSAAATVTTNTSVRSSTIGNGYPHQDTAHQAELAHERMLNKKLRSDMEKERRRYADVIESKALEQRRMERRLEVAEEEHNRTMGNLSVAQKQIQKLQLEKKAMFERSQAMKEITTKLLHFKPERVADVHTKDELELEIETVPRFFKKDLLMLLEERNKLKQELTRVREELGNVRARCVCASTQAGLTVHERSTLKHSWKQTNVRNILEESLSTQDGSTSLVTLRSQGCSHYRPRTVHVSVDLFSDVNGTSIANT